MAAAVLAENPVEPSAHAGHRARLRAKYAQAGKEALQDYELLELLLTFSMPHRDTKPYAKRLLASFKTVRAVLEAPLADLEVLGGLPPQSAIHMKAVGDLLRLARAEEWKRGRVIGSPSEVASYLREEMGAYGKEVFSVLYLDQRNHLLSCEKVQEGTVDQTVVYPREIMKRALELKATGLILAHNHPGGSLAPSDADRQLTHQILTAARAMGLTVHDHLILTAEGSFSFRQAGMLG
jgi:DNA repair protein RadC